MVGIDSETNDKVQELTYFKLGITKDLMKLMSSTARKTLAGNELGAITFMRLHYCQSRRNKPKIVVFEFDI